MTGGEERRSTKCRYLRIIKPCRRGSAEIPAEHYCGTAQYGDSNVGDGQGEDLVTSAGDGEIGGACRSPSWPAYAEMAAVLMCPVATRLLGSIPALTVEAGICLRCPPTSIATPHPPPPDTPLTLARTFGVRDRSVYHRRDRRDLCAL